MKCRIETITPDIARNILKANTANRNVRQNAVDEYATEMRSGRWGVTTDAIGIDEAGVVTNGQHRLLAIIQSGATIQALVARGVPTLVNGRDDLFTQDVTDAGRKRTVADQLGLKHGIPNATAIAAGCRAISNICTNRTAALPLGQANAILAIYGDELAVMVSILKNVKPVRKAGVYGTLALAMKVSKDHALAFANGLATGEGLPKGSPALALRNFFITHTFAQAGSVSQLVSEYTANAFNNYIQGNSVQWMKRGAIGLDFLRLKQRANVERVRVIVGA